MQRLMIAVLAAATLPVGSAGAASAKKAAAEASPVRKAIELANRGDHTTAVVQLASLRGNRKYRRQANRIDYYLGKSYYRLGLRHAALDAFARVLKAPASKYTDSALEWCLFLGRKMADHRAVHHVIADAKQTDFPKKYRDEFLFRQARYHFTEAVRLDVSAEVKGEARSEETVSGGKSFKGDIFGTGAESAPPAASKSDGGGLSFDDDIFGFSKPKKKAKKSKKRRSARRKRRRRRRRRAAPSKPVVSAPAKRSGRSIGGAAGTSAEEHLAAADRMLQRVNANSAYGPKAKFLAALVEYKRGNENKALGLFKEVVKATAPGQPGADPALRQLAFFQLARTHFGAKQPSFSMFYYRKIDRDDLAWLDALYESSWAAFRLGRYEKALGNLLTIHSPFFLDQQYPESYVLKAVIYYENCRYQQADRILKAFKRDYEPVRVELERLARDKRSPAGYAELLFAEKGDDASETSDAVARVLALVASDDEVKRLRGAVTELDDELVVLSEQSALLDTRSGTKVQTRIRELRSERAERLGQAVQRKLEVEAENVRTLIEQAVRIDIETAKAEQDRIESKLRDVTSQPKVAVNDYVEWTDDEGLVWPFDGEYWRDELGTYELTLGRTCQ